MKPNAVGALTTLTTLSLLSACLLSTTTFAASFDCRKASTWIEKSICSNAELSKLDEKMAQQYKAQVASDPSQKSQTLNEQRQWLSFQRDTCKTEACLIREYKERIGNKKYYGVSWQNASKLSAAELPNSAAFGKFTEGRDISMYDPSTGRWEDMGESTNTVAIQKVANKPYLGVVTGDFIFTNAHSCQIDNAKATWSENHWVVSDKRNGKTAELRLYPATYQGKAQLLLRDLDNQYRETNCGMRGYFDGIVLKRK